LDVEDAEDAVSVVAVDSIIVVRVIIIMVTITITVVIIRQPCAMMLFVITVKFSMQNKIVIVPIILHFVQIVPITIVVVLIMDVTTITIPALAEVVVHSSVAAVEILEEDVILDADQKLADVLTVVAVQDLFPVKDLAQDQLLLLDMALDRKDMHTDHKDMVPVLDVADMVLVLMDKSQDMENTKDMVKITEHLVLN